MRIGFDFDNTIVHYDAIFHKVALEQGVIDDTVAVSKLAVRDYLRQADKEDIWTEMQGYVYGARMLEADAYPGVISAMQQFKRAGHTLAIMSHKTKYPYMGEEYDLHAAAREWIKCNLLADHRLIIPEENIYFEITKEDKLARIESFGCDIFIDDLPEILLAQTFPGQVKRFLFDPDNNHANKGLDQLQLVSSWPAFAGAVV